MYSYLVSYHTNPYTCGVARFNQSLSRAIRAPLIQLDEFLERPLPGLALLSLKLEEVADATIETLILAVRTDRITFDVFLHASDGSSLEKELCRAAQRVFAASAEIASQVKSSRADAVPCFAPGAPVIPPLVEVDCRLLTFGMAHKIRSEGYRRLASLIQGDLRSFRLEISTALHEGGTFDENFFTVNSEISEAFRGDVTFLGFMADGEVSERLRTADALIAFFPRGARENNTTVLSAMMHCCPVITNLDDNSPEWMRHGETIFDIDSLTAFPSEQDLERVGQAGGNVAACFNFTALAEMITAES
jgi:hypothetical protein